MIRSAVESTASRYVVWRGIHGARRDVVANPWSCWTVAFRLPPLETQCACLFFSWYGRIQCHHLNNDRLDPGTVKIYWLVSLPSRLGHVRFTHALLRFSGVFNDDQSKIRHLTFRGMEGSRSAQLNPWFVPFPPSAAYPVGEAARPRGFASSWRPDSSSPSQMAWANGG